jgi:two-component system cell cycle sensor histidine kinase/response regulator CckA
VSSAPGDGACFDVWLPASAPEPAAPAPVPRGVRRSPPAGHTLLVVEDDETVRALMVRALEDAGYHTLAAAQGDEALALARACGGAIDLLVTDVVMPGHGGRQLFEALRIGRPELRVLFMSGYPRETLAARGLLAAELPCIRKPFGLAELLGVVSNALAGG